MMYDGRIELQLNLLRAAIREVVDEVSVAGFHNLSRENVYLSPTPRKGLLICWGWAIDPRREKV